MKDLSHILFAYAFDNVGKGQRLDNQNIVGEIENEGLAWVHLDANHKDTKSWLETEVNYLDHLIIDALTAEETRPRIIEFVGGLLIILRGVNLNESAQPQDMVSIRMWIDNDRVITIQRRDMKAIYDLTQKADEGKLIKNSGEFLYNLIYQILSNTSPFIYGLNERVDILEEKIMTTHDLKFREEILQIRTQSMMFKRYLVPQKEVVSKLRSAEYKWNDDWAKRHFQENFEHISRLIDEAEEASNRSQILHDELANALTEKLNKNMYKLSLITVIFMPLTFITGLFGMNVGGIPGQGNPAAFYTYASVMLIVILMHFLFFRKKDRF